MFIIERVIQCDSQDTCTNTHNINHNIQYIIICINDNRVACCGILQKRALLVILITKEWMFMHLTYFYMKSKLIRGKIEICFITKRIQIINLVFHIFAYLFDFYQLDHIFIFIMLLVHIWGFPCYTTSNNSDFQWIKLPAQKKYTDLKLKRRRFIIFFFEMFYEVYDFFWLFNSPVYIFHK